MTEIKIYPKMVEKCSGMLRHRRKERINEDQNEKNRKRKNNTKVIKTITDMTTRITLENL